MNIPINPSESTKRRNPQLWPESESLVTLDEHGKQTPVIVTNPLLNQTEQRCVDKLKRIGCGYALLIQAITLRLDPPFKSYRPDIAYLYGSLMVFVEVKGLHRFRRAGIAKAALAAKTYPQFRFELHEWDGKEWKESVLSG